MTQDEPFDLHLIGLIRYLLEDGELTSSEVYQLAEWLNNNPSACDIWPGNELVGLLNDVYQDSEVSAEELQAIGAALTRIDTEFESRQNQASNEIAVIPPVIDNGPLKPSRQLAEQRTGVFGKIAQFAEQLSLDRAWKQDLRRFEDEEKQRQRVLYVTEIIDSLKNESGYFVPQNLILRGKERACWAEEATLLEEVVTSRRYQGGSGGVRVRLMKGVSVNVGSHRGNLVSERGIVPVDHGEFIITTQRLIFRGQLRCIESRLEKMVDMKLHPDGIMFSESGKSKRRMIQFSKPNGDVVMAVLDHLIQTYSTHN